MRSFSSAFTWAEDQLVVLIAMHLRVHLHRLKEFVHALFYYYPRDLFFFIDFTLFMLYFFQSPYKVGKRFFKTEEHTYGETPLSTLDRIAKESRLLSRDIVFELGSGSGRSCFWLASLVGCEVHGIECVPLFVERAEKIKGFFRLKKLFFHKEDFLKMDFKHATFIYLYGICMKDGEIRELVKQLAHLSEGARVATVSFPLTDYDENGLFKVDKQFPASFPWGKAEIFIHTKN